MLKRVKTISVCTFINGMIKVICRVLHLLWIKNSIIPICELWIGQEMNLMKEQIFVNI